MILLWIFFIKTIQFLELQQIGPRILNHFQHNTCILLKKYWKRQEMIIFLINIPNVGHTKKLRTFWMGIKKMMTISIGLERNMKKQSYQKVMIKHLKNFLIV